MFKDKTYKPFGYENNTADPNDDWQKQQVKLQKQQEAARLAEQKRAEAERIKEQNRLAEEQRKAAEQAAQKQAEQAEKDRQKMIVQQEREQKRTADKQAAQLKKQQQSHEMYPRTRSEPLDDFDAKLRDLESPTMTNNRLHLESAQIMGMTDVSPEDFGKQQQAYFKTLERNVADEDLDQKLAQMEGPDNARARKSRELSQKLWPHENGMGQYMQSKTGVTDAIRMHRKAALKEYEDKAVDDEVNTRIAKWREDMAQAESDASAAAQAETETTAPLVSIEPKKDAAEQTSAQSAVSTPHEFDGLDSTGGESVHHPAHEFDGLDSTGGPIEDQPAGKSTPDDDFKADWPSPEHYIYDDYGRPVPAPDGSREKWIKKPESYGPEKEKKKGFDRDHPLLPLDEPQSPEQEQPGRGRIPGPTADEIKKHKDPTGRMLPSDIDQLEKEKNYNDIIKDLIEGIARELEKKFNTKRRK